MSARCPGKCSRLRPSFYTLTSDEVTVVDGSAVVTGLLLALTLPPGVPWWLPVAGSSVGLILGKHVFGGLGHNIFNPALVGRAFLLAAWPAHMTTWSTPVSWSGAAADAVTTATPLAAQKLSGAAAPLADLFLGTVAGSLGETSGLGILIGAAYLFYKKTITWHIPCSYLGTVLVAALLLGQDPVFHLLAGGLLFGAFFMATDVVTSPTTKPGRLVFGCMAGLLTILIRRYGGYPEWVCYAILIMNSLTPLIDKYTARTYTAGDVSIPVIRQILKQK